MRDGRDAGSSPAAAHHTLCSEKVVGWAILPTMTGRLGWVGRTDHPSPVAERSHGAASSPRPDHSGGKSGPVLRQNRPHDFAVEFLAHRGAEVVELVGGDDEGTRAA